MREFQLNRHSYLLFSLFCLTLFAIGYFWWPLAEAYLNTFNPAVPWWRQVDLLLVGIFLAMSVLMMLGADLRADARTVLVGLLGGLVIESWGTQTHLWTYYTLERPPLWIIPAWPIASLAIDRLFKMLMRLTGGPWEGAPAPWRWDGWGLAYGGIFLGFGALMLNFVWPTLDKPLTLAALALCALLALSPTHARAAVLTFAAGAGLGYFLELWGTTRACWTYYTGETPPLFAVLAHGMAAVAFWRAQQLLFITLPQRWPLSRRPA